MKYGNMRMESVKRFLYEEAMPFYGMLVDVHVWPVMYDKIINTFNHDNIPTEWLPNTFKGGTRIVEDCREALYHVIENEHMFTALTEVMTDRNQLYGDYDTMCDYFEYHCNPIEVLASLMVTALVVRYIYEDMSFWCEESGTLAAALLDVISIVDGDSQVYYDHINALHKSFYNRTH